MKRIILLSLLLITICSCSKQPQCNDEDSKALVLDILNDNTKADFNLSLYNIIAHEFKVSPNKDRITANRINLYKGGGAVIKSVRTIDQNEELKTCECVGEFDLSKKEIETIRNYIKDHDLYQLDNIYNDTEGMPISYSLQITDDGDLYAEVEVTQDHLGAFMAYSAIKELISEDKDERKNDSNKSNNSVSSNDIIESTLRLVNIEQDAENGIEYSFSNDNDEELLNVYSKKNFNLTKGKIYTFEYKIMDGEHMIEPQLINVK